ncbi:VOC family protein [Leifsonia sp. AG29]|uniref:VOC family protein n=1 Tax=Leifsonia sp. AG29 TaxID=2598860 RepID=UPI00131CB640|nr:VOC family protein [Leifsonia sp. AG29]
MNFASIRIITSDVDQLAAFYGRLTGLEVLRPNPLFAQIPGPTGLIAIASDKTVPAMSPADLSAAANRSVIIEFLVDDVDRLIQGLSLGEGELVMEPRTMPWGNRSALVRDPDGNLVNLYAPPSTN